MHSRFFSRDSAGVPSQLLRFWKKKIQSGSPHYSGGDNAEKRDQEDLLGAAKLHDDVKGQVKQQVADEDAQHVGSEVPGSVDESKEGEGPVNQVPHDE